MNGVLILDKPQGFTSFDAVAVVRGLAGERKIGHTGTLDPLATGVLPLLLGPAAKAADLLPDTDKAYRAAFRLGERRDTGDVTGQVVARDQTHVSRETLERALAAFRGEISQTPPMYSAVSVGGKRLYQLARQGVEVPRPARRVTVTELTLERYDEAAREGELFLRCSKGTYVRALIEDAAQAAGSLGTMTALRRVAACGFTLADALPLEEVRALAAAGELPGALRPVDSLFPASPQVRVSAAQAARFSHGGGLALDRLRASLKEDGQRVRVYGPDGLFLGLGRVDLAGGELRFLKFFAQREAG